ncbi:gas vesicle protein [Hamadaea sp. NPDC050747]|uniref:gas vesicle protein n=1 Tax=Hamadaea sp. NPDC050747 TaxID=3155789 RepID=UPI0033F45347
MTESTTGMAQPLGAPATGQQSANLGDILERVLDKGLVIVGDIKVNLLDIELLTVKLRLLVASVETARQLGIDWWQHDPWLTSGAQPAVGGPTSTPVTGPRREAIANGDHFAEQRFSDDRLSEEQNDE